MKDNLLTDQAVQRTNHLQAILDSPSPKMLIVAGPGTGKTFTFGQVLRKSNTDDNLALTFIRKLVRDMERELEGLAEVKTFHAYCKKLLHEKHGGMELFPFLTQVMHEDAKFLDQALFDFDNAFQTLDEESDEISFYLRRGDYYNAVSFNDSVYRVLKGAQEDPRFIPQFGQIVIDEFQDFNPLEVAFIDELENHGPILIVGDDDQAVYSLRNSSPDYLRDKFRSGDYESFELPFCSRCPRVVVEATSSFISGIIETGGLESRVDRPFVPFLEDKEYENEAYPKIISATCSNISCVGKLIRLAIQNIPNRDIEEAHDSGYPCVLIVGLRQYLNPLKKNLDEHFTNVAFTQSANRPYSIVDAYEILLNNVDSNLGWRVLAGVELPRRVLEEVVQSSQDFTSLRELLPEEFIEKHLAILEVLCSPQLEESDQHSLDNLLGEHATQIIDHFYPSDEEDEEVEQDLSEPSILLSSFEGCKGLSAGHVFIVGLNDGIMPRINAWSEIDDIEISKFIVAMTRTRKLLYLLSNRWDYGPNGPRFYPSTFMDYVPEEFQHAAGYIKSDGVDSLIAAVWGDHT